jgi:hypothetical protein
MQAACEPTNDGKELLKSHMRRFLGWDTLPQAMKMTIHPLGAGQTLEHMLGYVQKDRGKPHYALLSHDITDAELQAGGKAYSEVAGDYRINKVLITRKGFVGRVWAYWHANFWPFVVPCDVVVLCMLRSGQYVPDGSWCTSSLGHGVDFSVSAAWWMMVTRPDRAMLEQVRVLFWAWHEVPGTQWRYFSQARSFSAGLSKLEAAVCDVWYVLYKHTCGACSFLLLAKRLFNTFSSFDRRAARRVAKSAETQFLQWAGHSGQLYNWGKAVQQCNMQCTSISTTTHHQAARPLHPHR